MGCNGCHDCGEFVKDVGCPFEPLETAYPCRHWKPLGVGGLVAAFKADFALSIAEDDHICPETIIAWLERH